MSPITRGAIHRHVRTLAALSFVFAIFLSGGVARGESALTITVDPQTPQAAVSPEFLGLSFEMEKVLPDSEGKHYFSPDNQKLIATFKTLGIKNLRVGGNTADNPKIKVPSPPDIDQLFGFAKAAGVKVIYTLRMREGNPQIAADTAKFIMDHYASELTCLAIGNEPNVFATEYPVYRQEWEKYANAVNAAAPNAKFCGPSATPGKVAWARDFVNDIAPSGRVVLVTQHDYPGNSARKVTDTAAARELMLSRDWVKYYEKFYGGFVPTTLEHHLSYRLEEANSFFHGGAKDVSDTLASALWGLDYAYWWASHGCNGINFHTGDNVAAADDSAVCRYAIFRTSADGFAVSPLGHAVKAFDVSGHGHFVPTKIASNADNLNLTAYGVLADDKSLSIVLVNKEHGSPAHDATVTLETSAATPRGQVMYLAGPSGDLAATSGIVLGSAAIEDNATWRGVWKPLDGSPSMTGHFLVKVPAASAAIVKVSPN